jgi:hypothetical protein
MDTTTTGRASFATHTLADEVIALRGYPQLKSVAALIVCSTNLGLIVPRNPHRRLPRYPPRRSACRASRKGGQGSACARRDDRKRRLRVPHHRPVGCPAIESRGARSRTQRTYRLPNRSSCQPYVGLDNLRINASARVQMAQLRFYAASFAAILPSMRFLIRRRVRSTNASLSARQLSSSTPTP